MAVNHINKGPIAEQRDSVDTAGKWCKHEAVEGKTPNGFSPRQRRLFWVEETIAVFS